MSGKTLKVMVTGANGFVGSALCDRLAEEGIPVVGAVRERRPRNPGVAPIEWIEVGAINRHTRWTAALENVEVVVHLAARVHVMQETAHDPLEQFRLVNTLGTEALARQAAAAGVKRFVYVSTIKVNGERTAGDVFRPDDQPKPEDPYSRSKWEAEQVLQDVSAQTGMEIVVVRPPLVYGPRVKGNFLSMLRVVQRGIPLPLARCRNRRSLIGLSNLADLLTTCVVHPEASGKIWLASDGEDLSTPDLLQRVAKALGRKSRLVPFPVTWLHWASILAGRSSIYGRLCESLQVDSSHLRHHLQWTPPMTVDDELVRTAQWFRNNYP